MLHILTAPNKSPSGMGKGGSASSPFHFLRVLRWRSNTVQRKHWTTRDLLCQKKTSQQLKKHEGIYGDIKTYYNVQPRFKETTTHPQCSWVGFWDLQKIDVTSNYSCHPSTDKNPRSGSPEVSNTKRKVCIRLP